MKVQTFESMKKMHLQYALFLLHRTRGPINVLQVPRPRLLEERR